MRTMIIVGLVALTSACAVSQVDPLSVPLAYKAPEKPVFLHAAACGAFSSIKVADLREDKQLGIRFHETKPLKAEVTAANDPAGWVQDGMQRYLTSHGVAVAPRGPELLVDLHVLRTEEDIWHRASYDARVSVLARLQAPSGKVCAEESVEGKAGNYGYAGSTENYQETLNSALDDVSQHLLDDPQFATALCQCGG